MHDVQHSDLNPLSNATPSPQSAEELADLRSRLASESEKNQLRLISELVAAGEPGLEVLMDFLQERQSVAAGLVEGKTYGAIAAANTPKTQDFLQTHFPQGIVPLQSERGVDYAPLQRLLVQQEFEVADRVTLEKMCELAGGPAIQRKWLYFTEVEKFPATDLHTINRLWLVHSEGRFGFSVQRELWLGVNKNWDKLWPQIGWKAGNNWTRYPQEFTWDLTAPRGHLPLSNQLRGVRVMAALLSHPAWTDSASASA